MIENLRGPISVPPPPSAKKPDKSAPDQQKAAAKSKSGAGKKKVGDGQGQSDARGRADGGDDDGGDDDRKKPSGAAKGKGSSTSKSDKFYDDLERTSKFRRSWTHSNTVYGFYDNSRTAQVRRNIAASDVQNWKTVQNQWYEDAGEEDADVLLRLYHDGDDGKKKFVIHHWPTKCQIFQANQEIPSSLAAWFDKIFYQSIN